MALHSSEEPMNAPTALNSNGLSPAALATLPSDVQQRLADAWSDGRALILNANKPGYSEAFSIESEQYVLLRNSILEAVHALAGDDGEALLKDVVTLTQGRLGTHPLFPNGRMTNYTRYVKTDLEARGELERIPKSSPQRIRLVSH